MAHKVKDKKQLWKLVRGANFQKINSKWGLYCKGRASFVADISSSRHSVVSVLDTPTLYDKERLIERLLKRE